MELLLGSDPPIEPSHIFLTRVARFAQWTGFYVRGLIALFLSGSFTTKLIMCAAMHDLPMCTG